MPKLVCDVCETDIRPFYNASAAVVELNNKLISMALESPQGAKILTAGRVVVLRDDVSLSTAIGFSGSIDSYP